MNSAIKMLMKGVINSRPVYLFRTARVSTFFNSLTTCMTNNSY